MNLIEASNLGVQNPFKKRYGNYIGGKWQEPLSGQYFENVTPITGQVFCEVPRSNASDIEAALDAAHAAKATWSKTSPTERAAILLKIADRMEENLKLLAVAETVDKGKPLRESISGDIPLAIDHFRYFASCIRTEEGTISEIDNSTYSYHYKEPLGVVGQIIPWNFPLLMAAWKIAPALAAGNCIVLKPAEQTPASILVLVELIQDLLPPGVLNVVNGFGLEAGKPLASSPRIAKIAFTGETTTGQLIMGYAAENLIPVTLELGGKSPSIYFDDVAAKDDALFEKAVESFAMFTLNQGEACTCPSRYLVQESVYERFIERAVKRIKAIKIGNPLDMATMIGAQASKEQFDKIMSYIKIGFDEGATCLSGGRTSDLAGELKGGWYIEPTIFRGENKMRIFQEEIFGPVAGVTTFKTEEEALHIANDTQYGLAAAVWTRDISVAHRMSKGIQAGRVWNNCYHLYPAHSAFGGYKKSGIGRETHKMMLNHYQNIKNVIVSHDPNPTGFY
ncbi:aldehyde dehydrogenase family protein [Paraburkholderia rhynchosiae]|uniref:Aldehyde dehydrogenase n=1 Tax=Paraburkholderia rhynchosiae TaxID=487049 RepID=A0A2N7WHK2_9BURK|nr:aldehyde dehydrogenase family protein [Paraburkholderia rhynchosiae]PMS28853.1 aldehyde dehydrogenase [Paraburkholderia rhynchosiae]CAB3656968.1 Acetaldehyde dehydrogenase 2 [Paraburkholderia rhynchosiae]